MAGYMVKEHLWKTKDGKIVRDGDPRSAFLFAVPGMVLAEKPEILASIGTKAVRLSEDKAVKPGENK